MHTQKNLLQVNITSIIHLKDTTLALFATLNYLMQVQNLTQAVAGLHFLKESRTVFWRKQIILLDTTEQKYFAKSVMLI